MRVETLPAGTLCVSTFSQSMPTAAERKALAFLAGVALLGGGARVWMQHRLSESQFVQHGSAIAAESVEGQLSAIDSAKASRPGKKRAPKSGGASSPRALPSRSTRSSPDERLDIIDVDRATAVQLEQLPRVGPAMADRIVANRDSLGAFGSLDALGEVRGIGPAMLELLSPLVTFSGRPRATVAKSRTRRGRTR